MAWIKIDDALTDDDDALSSAIPLSVTRNVSANVVDRRIGCSHAYPTLVKSATNYKPILSTHPDHWYAIPLVIPAQVGMTTLTAVVYCESTVEDVDLALSVEGVVGSTVTATPGAAGAITLTVGIPDGPEGGWWRGSIRLRSHAAEDAHRTVQINRSLRDRMDTTMSSALGATGKAHYLLELTSATYAELDHIETRYHVPRVTDVPGSGGNPDVTCYIWPNLPNTPLIHNVDGSLKDGASLYQLGVLEIDGFALYLSGDAGTYAIPPDGNCRAGQRVRAYDVWALDRALVRLHRERAWWLTCGPNGPEKSWVGGYSGSNSRISATALYQVREEHTSVEGAMLWMPTESESGSIGWAMAASAVDGSPSTVTETVSITGRTVEPLEVVSGTGMLCAYNVAQSGLLWGAGDLCLAGEELALNLATFVVPSSGAPVGEYVAVGVGPTDGAKIWVGGVSLREGR